MCSMMFDITIYVLAQSLMPRYLQQSRKAERRDHELFRAEELPCKRVECALLHGTRHQT